jgi:hypothetical protein
MDDETRSALTSALVDAVSRIVTLKELSEAMVKHLEFLTTALEYTLKADDPCKGHCGALRDLAITGDRAVDDLLRAMGTIGRIIKHGPGEGLLGQGAVD